LNFEGKPKLARVYISPELKRFIIPYDLRNITKAAENYSKGTRLDVSFKGMTEEVREIIIEDIKRKLEKNKKKEKELFEKKKKYEIKYVNWSKSKQCIPESFIRLGKVLNKKMDNLKKFIKKNEQELETLNNSATGSTYIIILDYMLLEMLILL